MLVVGLTGSIAMGKSTVAEMLRSQGIPVFDADAEVHRLYEGRAVALIEAAFLGTTSGGRVDRGRLADAIAGDPAAIARLESLVHPLVQDAERDFLRREAGRGAPIAVLEIPLLFETGADARVDAVIVVSASDETQRTRLSLRPGMVASRLEALLARQMPDGEKRARADFVVDTNGTLAESRSQLDAIMATLARRESLAFERHWK